MWSKIVTNCVSAAKFWHCTRENNSKWTVSLLVYAVAFLHAASALAINLELKSEHGTLRSPELDVPTSIRNAHKLYVCWADGVRSLEPHYVNGVLRRVILDVDNEECGLKSVKLTFDLDSVGAYKVLKLVSPKIKETPLSAYPSASLVLSVADASLSPMVWVGGEPLYHFRMVLKHKYESELTKYGDVIATYKTLHQWRLLKVETLGSRIVDDPANCDPRFPNTPCRYEVTVTRRTVENSLNGEKASREFETWERIDL
jgi:hypothetical protein